MPDAVDDDPTPVPDAEHLQRLDRAHWTVLLRHAREAMKDLDVHLLTPRIERLRAVPVSKLAGGRSRRDLVRLLAEGGPLWRATVDRVHTDPGVELSELLSDAALAAPTSTSEGADDGGGDGGADDRGDDERVHRLKERARDLKDERDDARRRAEGLEARLRTEQERFDELEEELARVRADRDRLAERLDEAADEREQALERLQRRHDAQVYELREELRTHRRRKQQREERRRLRQERRRDAEAEAQEQIEAHLEDRREGRSAEPGRPSTLPGGIRPDTADAVDALLTRGRRVVVDGYNITKQHRDHLDLEQQRRWLLTRAGQLERRRGVRCVVVFDGDAATRSRGARRREASAVFTADGTADDRIVAMVDGLPEDEPVLVVTDDRELQDRVRGRGADVVGTRAFVAHLR